MENQTNNQEPINNNDKPSVGWQILAFIIPIAGIIMYFNNNKEFPIKAKRYIQLAGFSIALSLILRLI
tara:strand:- start:202 stop:405 length:204 start_codon:yes stop_codon:yes gene_type:complete